jgi:hypothetical protein
MKSQAGRPRSVDYNKILSLHKKGLSLRKIAESVGCSHYTVFCVTRIEVWKNEKRIQ